MRMKQLPKDQIDAVICAIKRKGNYYYKWLTSIIIVLWDKKSPRALNKEKYVSVMQC